MELDLLRGGARLPTVELLPPADYYAFVIRVEAWPQVQVLYWRLRDPLPEIPVPLAGDDPDVSLDLQSVFEVVFDRARYDYSLDYRRGAEPPLTADDARWAAGMLAAAAQGSPS